MSDFVLPQTFEITRIRENEICLKHKKHDITIVRVKIRSKKRILLCISFTYAYTYYIIFLFFFFLSGKTRGLICYSNKLFAELLINPYPFSIALNIRFDYKPLIPTLFVDLNIICTHFENYQSTILTRAAGLVRILVYQTMPGICV